MDIILLLKALILGIVEGLTEFLPVSSSGHLAIASRLFFADDAGASFTAVSQLGTELAVLVYFARDIWRIVRAWFAGLTDKARRDVDYRMGWLVIIGSVPIMVFGLLFKDVIRTGVRNLWVVATALVVFSLVIAAAEYFGRQTRHAENLTWRDGLTVGLAQCLALVPGVSRSGATISAGLFLGLDRELAARFGFLLAIPAVFASGLFSLPDAFAPVSESKLPGSPLAPFPGRSMGPGSHYRRPAHKWEGSCGDALERTDRPGSDAHSATTSMQWSPWPTCADPEDIDLTITTPTAQQVTGTLGSSSTTAGRRVSTLPFRLCSALSVSVNDGRSSWKMTLRPNSTAVAGAAPRSQASSRVNRKCSASIQRIQPWCWL